MYVYICIYIYIYECTHVCVYVYVCMYACMYICMDIYIYIYIYIYINRPFDGQDPTISYSVYCDKDREDFFFKFLRDIV